MSQLLPKNKSWQKKSRTYPKSANPTITPKGTLTFPMKYMAKILPGVTPDVANHKSLSADLKIWD